MRDASERISNCVIAISDTEALRRAEAQISHLAFHDALTGLGNRHTLDEAIEREISRSNQHGNRIALLFIDLDGFKLINDTMGHPTGDRLLKEVARRISRILRRSDTAIRLGGDEFVVLMPEVLRPDDCASLAEKLLCEIRTSIDLDPERVSISASIGIALYPDNASSGHELVQAADSAMYGAKERGRNRFAFYSPDMAERAMERLHIEQGLLRAISNDHLLLQFQPVVKLIDGRLVGFEALIRWDEPTHGRIGPDRFIPVAEECGLIEYIGSWVLRTACNHGAHWIGRGFADIRMAVNVSVRQMNAEGFYELVEEVLAETGFPAAQLELEITESTLQRVEHSRELLGRLKRPRGWRLDRRFRQFSPLSLLKHLPIDRIKIDRSFIKDPPDDLERRGYHRIDPRAGQQPGMELIAEGVETVAQRQFLVERGCQEAQGFPVLQVARRG